MTVPLNDIAPLIGTPFEYGGRGPDTYDCWGLVRLLLRWDGITAPDYHSDDNYRKIAASMDRQMHLWRKCESAPGRVILFRVRGLPCHVGYQIDKRRFVHTWEGSGGVLIEKLRDWEQRVTGFYEYVGE